ncbi:LmeA family phospholipid-binding protein [Synechococcales cyanobacterium C]|uniref:LmeA family phospholipid-binding protein n=1 Tax=Petrachloros mirabilis ULC683 TaxID=2781853 RepID=A0A8K1ZW48_9CYAN|nr:DUF2993 domain-containing protein [Petrachloros mirabilis]NCJ06330.1 LmeA family phospholipid-binding protein [Petrachloros mirabilis ULC683]
MFGSLSDFKNANQTDFGEQLLNTVASQSLRRLFTESDVIDVTIRCYPSSKLLQGSIDSFKMHGQGLVIRREFRTAEMSFETDAITLDFGSILKGQIKLKQPAQAIAQVSLTEDDINQAFTAKLVRQRLEHVETPALLALSGDEPVTFSQVSLQLLPNNQVKIFTQATLPHHGEVPTAIIATLMVERRRRIGFQNAIFQPDQIPEALHPISQRLGKALAEILDNMVDLERFNLDGVDLRINRLETQGQNLLFSGYAQINHFPKQG